MFSLLGGVFFTLLMVATDIARANPYPYGFTDMSILQSCCTTLRMSRPVEVSWQLTIVGLQNASNSQAVVTLPLTLSSNLIDLESPGRNAATVNPALDQCHIGLDRVTLSDELNKNGKVTTAIGVQKVLRNQHLANRSALSSTMKSSNLCALLVAMTALPCSKSISILPRDGYPDGFTAKSILISTASANNQDCVGDRAYSCWTYTCFEKSGARSQISDLQASGAGSWAECSSPTDDWTRTVQQSLGFPKIRDN
ncbi:hypothetical protein IE81DRAFT_332671 [Ceraceosorus guamensis]|uniref:Uncharacterized protein n=1 Tax=Ceraceosorus guamensis TaxID=1522189 RepID=A0A316VMZ9_9BASI|nr:hypothetical protein IE81DRAFT_332671 [Ceraceosorus guamensis]PWN38952.1 hypothetical protein IE81DRAFT_332671 [Ceraceosorus guamensis]